jgi:hypothetical protein
MKKFFKMFGIFSKTNGKDITDKEKLQLLDKLLQLIEEEGFESIAYTQLISKEEASKLIVEMEE